MDSSDWSNGIRYHIFDTRPDTEFKPARLDVLSSFCRALVTGAQYPISGAATGIPMANVTVAPLGAPVAMAAKV